MLRVVLPLADAENFGPTNRAYPLCSRFSVLKSYFFRVLDLPLGPALEAIGVHFLSPSLVCFDSQDTQ